MKLVVVGNARECLGFSLAGCEGVVVGDEGEFVMKMEKLLGEREVGVIALADRYASLFGERFAPQLRKRAVPAVVFIPSSDGKHHDMDLKEYLAGFLGIRL